MGKTALKVVEQQSGNVLDRLNETKVKIIFMKDAIIAMALGEAGGFGDDNVFGFHLLMNSIENDITNLTNECAELMKGLR